MRQLTVAALLSIYCVGPAYGQQCLHGAGETSEQQGRRRQAVTAARAVNTIQANRPGKATQQYLRQVELGSSTYAMSHRDTLSSLDFSPGQEVLPGWELRLDLTEVGYWFMIKDKTDPCGFTYISNERGLIYSAEPIR
jgi:hypothetical protein